MARKKKEQEPPPTGTWQTTYGDMITLCLCFFVILFNPDDVTQGQLEAITTSIQTGGIGSMAGGLTLSAGRNAELGNTVMSLPSMERGNRLGTALRLARSIFSPEIRSEKVKITQDERGLVISLAGDVFFNPASARINIESTREILLRLGTFLSSNELIDTQDQKFKFRIEGHTDAVDIDPTGPWEDNWHLSVERARVILRYLAAYGVNERRFQIAGFADTVPVATNDTEEGRRLNRRVDVIILTEGHL